LKISIIKESKTTVDARRSPEGKVELRCRWSVQTTGGRSQVASRLRHKSSMSKAISRSTLSPKTTGYLFVNFRL